MGNVLLLPCMCKEARVAVQTTAGGAKKTKRIKRPAVGNKNVVLSPEQGGVGEKMVPWQEVAAGEEYGVRLKVVMTRKDAAEFMARLEERAAPERKSRMGELGGGNGVISPCRDLWRPRLATIPEN